VPRRASCAAGCSCASRRRQGRLAACPCTVSRRARIVRAPLRAFSAVTCDARHRERRRDPRIRASLHYLDVSAWKASASALACLSLRLLRQDAAETGPPEARRGCAGKVRRRPRTMRGRSLNVQGCTSSEPRSALADLEGRMPGRRARRGCVSLVIFLCTSQYCPVNRRIESIAWPKGPGQAVNRSEPRPIPAWFARTA